jgi:hypothetical protein
LDSTSYGKAIRPVIVAEADSVDIEPVTMIGFVIAQFWTSPETWEIAEPLDRS